MLASEIHVHLLNCFTVNQADKGTKVHHQLNYQMGWGLIPHSGWAFEGNKPILKVLKLQVVVVCLLGYFTDHLVLKYQTD